MNVAEFFKDGLKVNPLVGRFIVGGGLVLAMAAMALAWFGDRWDADRPSVVYAVMGVLAVAAFATVLAVLAPRREEARTQRVLFSWSAVILFVAYTWALFASIVTPDWPRPFACLAQPWQRCEEVRPDSRPAPPPPGAAASPAGAPAGQVRRADYLVKLQFGGAMNRETQIKPMARELVRRGWSNFPGASGGGQRVSAPGGLSEIRYGRPQDEAAAAALAADVGAALSPNRTVTPKLNPQIAPGELEIWLTP